MALHNHSPVTLLCFPQNFSPQLSGGYDEKSGGGALAVPGPMVRSDMRTPIQPIKDSIYHQFIHLS